MTSEPTCPEVGELLPAYLDDALPPERRQGLEAHLGVCTECCRTLAELRCTRRLLRNLPASPMPERMKQRLLDHLRHRRLPES